MNIKHSHHYSGLHQGVVYAILAAVLFGASTPFAKALVGQIAPVTLAGMLYAGSGLGLLAFYLLRILVQGVDRHDDARLTMPDVPWLAGAILAGGVAAPVLLMVGLTLTPSSTASLLLNMEGVLTSLLAWFVFKENFDRRIFIGMLLIVAAGVLLSWQQIQTVGLPWGAVAIIGACLFWGIDNNLTRKVSISDAVQIACLKGLIAGSVNLMIAYFTGASWPAWTTALSAGVIGLSGYGLSLALFVLALRHLGTARTGAYFSLAPFAGAAISLAMLGEQPSGLFWLAAALMGAGIWLHLTESHEHEHHHETMAHLHSHRHDAHHQHDHDFEWNGVEPHTHQHHHAPLTHAHKHYPDIHHRHKH